MVLLHWLFIFFNEITLYAKLVATASEVIKIVKSHISQQEIYWYSYICMNF